MKYYKKSKTFFDVTDGTKTVTSFGVDWENDSFIMVAQNLVSEKMHRGKKVDISKISKAISDTTRTMYKKGRYVDVSEEQVDEIQTS